MTNVSNFKRLPSRHDASVTVFVEGQAVQVQAHDSAAAAILAAGLGHSRTTPITGSGRAPYCMMGVCFECLVEIDGQANTQGCMTLVREGMQIKRQQQARLLTDSQHD
ncbi:2Fe-2S iron-sulfur cluster binding domain-containing protein [Oceanospirillum multiglobuliferum]|uniref:Sarcosine oxidase subunit alpha n=1 Tax=Oceanospirillum multiglobuliferum TaxID=64969 RepID=A0A1T4PIT0_9GAMM|nr:(2Fe-2S)-binding protein [Oceanospirillum multiglobuliferum]OPX55532.1 hypothetical protein BTE48_07865 [Oceanospirillum multiglobuliferum]SJZ91311.1 2Fe-2S iron-sulfur cluster binding domain-containing protein [Oceanospirillum multiglobuliferum]